MILLIICIFVQLMWRTYFLLPVLTRKNLWILTYVFDWFYFIQCYFVFPYQSPSSPLCKIFDAFSSNINEVLSIKPSANVSVFGGFNVHHKDLLTYPGELCYNFLTLLKWLTFLIGSLTVTITVLLFCIYLFIYCEASIYSTVNSPPLENFNHVVVSDSIDVLSNPK